MVGAADSVIPLPLGPVGEVGERSEPGSTGTISRIQGPPTRSPVALLPDIDRPRKAGEVLPSVCRAACPHATVLPQEEVYRVCCSRLPAGGFRALAVAFRPRRFVGCGASSSA